MHIMQKTKFSIYLLYILHELITNMNMHTQTHCKCILNEIDA